jgi:hypothetical protein
MVEPTKEMSAKESTSSHQAVNSIGLSMAGYMGEIRIMENPEPLTDLAPNRTDDANMRIPQVKAKAPKWLLKQESIDQRQWRYRKRADVRNLRAAFNRFRMGSAYTNQPRGTTDALERLIASLEQSTSVAEWGK